MVIAFDLDGTLCSPISKCDSIKEVKGYIVNEGLVAVIEELVKNGHSIVIYTHRSSDLKEATEKWLSENKVPYHELVMDKPKYDLLIDDKTYPPYNFITAKFIEGYIDQVSKWNFKLGAQKPREKK